MKTCTLEQAKRLKELGVEQKANSTWTSENDYRYPFGYGYLYGPKDYAAFDTDELLAMMPYAWLISKTRGNKYKLYTPIGEFSGYMGGNPAEALADGIIDMCRHENKGFSIPEINERIKQYNNA